MLIEMCGGNIVRSVKDLPRSKRENTVAVVRLEKNSLIEFREDVVIAKKMGFDRIYTIEMVLDACERQAINWEANRIES